MTDQIQDLWITLLETQAKVDGIDLSEVPDCVLRFYADRDMTVREALDALSANARSLP